MTRRTRLLAGSALLAALTATPAAAQMFAAAAPGPSSGSDKAIAALLEQANYWKLQNRPDQVARALDRVLAVDPDEQRMSLSIKALAAKPAPAAGHDDAEGPEDSAAAAEQPPQAKKRNSPLKGGLGGQSVGERFGLKW